jgi:LEA14-like dessication related protein
MPAPLRRLAFLLVLLAPLSACFLTRPVEKPTAVVRGASISIASLTALEGELALDVSNPNSFGLPLTGIDWELAIAGAAAVSGRVAAQTTIPAMGSAPVTTALRIDLANAAAAAAALARGSRDYQLAVRLHFSTQLGDLTVDLRHQGSIAGGLPSLPW